VSFTRSHARSIAATASSRVPSSASSASASRRHVFAARSADVSGVSAWVAERANAAARSGSPDVPAK